MNVAQVLKDKGRSVVIDRADTTIGDIVRDLARERIGAIVIVERDNRVIGIVSERDVMQAIATMGAACLDRPVSEIMTRNVVTCVEQDTLNDLMGKMTEGRFRHIPVVDDERIVGIVSIGDVVKHHIAEVEMEAHALKSYVAG
ncbi:MAG: CBS domain-containing protein [Hyphomicrobiaceae bacterium]